MFTLPWYKIRSVVVHALAARIFMTQIATFACAKFMVAPRSFDLLLYFCTELPDLHRCKIRVEQYRKRPLVTTGIESIISYGD